MHLNEKNYLKKHNASRRSTKSICDLEIDKDFTKSTNRKLDFIIIKNSCSTVEKMKTRDCKNIFIIQIPAKELVQKIHKELFQLNNEK